MKFEIFKSRKNSCFYFRLKAKNGRIILISQAYQSKKSCKKGSESVRKNSNNYDQFIRKKTPTRKYHFNLQATNLQIIGSSQTYSSKSAMEKGIRSVMANAPEARIVDLTQKASD